MSNSMFTTKQVLRKARILKNPSKVYARQKGLHKCYKENPYKYSVLCHYL